MSEARPGRIDEHIQLEQFSLVLRRPANVESLIDDDRFDEDEFLPYWAELWPSGLALARYVVRLDLGGKRVLELGCGLALPSFAAALAGAEVLATDWAPEALALVEVNAAANGLHVATAVLHWSIDNVPEAPRFDLAVAADVLYELRNSLPLLDRLAECVSPGGEALIADPGRRHAAAFFNHAREAGWLIEHIAVAALPAGGIARLRRADSVGQGTPKSTLAGPPEV